MTPYLSVCGPPELVATLPPMVQAPWLDGSGAKCQPCGLRWLRQPEVDDAGLDDGVAIAVVDFEDALHPRQRDHDAAADRQTTARQAGAGAARQEGHVELVADADDLHHLLGRGGKDDDVGLVLLDGEAVAFVDEQFAGRGSTPSRPTMGRRRSRRAEVGTDMEHHSGFEEEPLTLSCRASTSRVSLGNALTNSSAERPFEPFLGRQPLKTFFGRQPLHHLVHRLTYKFF